MTPGSTIVRALCVLVGAAALSACAADQPASSDHGSAAAKTGEGAGNAHFPVRPGEYDAVFARAKETLRAQGFSLDRVDAREGIITTRLRPSSGFATPWTGAEGSWSASATALFNVERRLIEVTFLRDASEPPDSARAFTECRVRARIIGLREPGRRVESASIRLSSYEEDAELKSRGMLPEIVVDSGEDPGLAARLAAIIAG